MDTKELLKQAINIAPDLTKEAAAFIMAPKEDKTITDCSKGEFTLIDKTYVAYSMHNIIAYAEKGATEMMSEADFIKSLSHEQLYAIGQLGLTPQPVDKVQEFLDNADKL